MKCVGLRGLGSRKHWGRNGHAFSRFYSFFVGELKKLKYGHL